MKVKRMTIVAADTSKHDYIVEVKNLLDNHDCSNHNKNQFDNYLSRAQNLLKIDPNTAGNSDKDRALTLLLSA